MAFLYPVTQPLKIYLDTNGEPLQNGYIYFGVANENPETSPVQMYWDAAGLIPAAQPIRTWNGYIIRNGAAANIFATGDFSITIRDANGAFVLTYPTSTDIQLAQAIAGGGTAAAIPLADAGGYFTTDNVEAAFQQLGPLIAQMVTALAGTVPVGATFDYPGVTAPSGYVLYSGRTIGSVSSGATERANADTANLYAMLWDNWSNTELPIQDSAGTPTTRGASASNDFAANKRLPLPDCRGRVRAGKDNMGGSTASRLTSASGVVGTTMGESGGTETHTLITEELASHAHTLTDPQHTHTFTGVAHSHTYTRPNVDANTNISGGLNGCVTTVTGSVATSSVTATGSNASVSTGITMANTGSGTAHQNTQPTIIFSVIGKL